MGRRVFLSTLGSNAYGEVRYLPLAGEPRTPATPYIQEARLRAMGDEVDEVVILVTEGLRGSLDANWLARTVRVPGPSLKFDKAPDGLRMRLEALRGAGLTPVVIPSGASETELWAIFDRLSELVEAGDELYIDVTHGFRTLPIVLLIALEYLQRAKGVQIKQVSYGAYEAKAPGSDGAPTFDLTPFFVLQDWTAALVLLESGDLRALGRVLRRAVGPLQRELRGAFPGELRKLPDHLEALGDVLQMSRLRDLPGAVTQVLEALGAVRGAFARIGEVSEENPVLSPMAGALKPMTAVIQRVRGEVEHLRPKASEPDEVWGLLAAKYCVEYGMLAQGLTLFRETLLDYFLRISGCAEASRKDVDGFFGAFAATGALYDKGIPEGCRVSFWALHRAPHTCLGESAEVAAARYKEMKKIVSKIAEWRNDLNHAWTASHAKLSSARGRQPEVLKALERVMGWMTGARVTVTHQAAEGTRGGAES